VISDKEKKLISKLLDLAHDQFANHICNDVPDNWFEGWTEEEKIALDEHMHELNGDPEEKGPPWLYLIDSSLMWYFSELLLKEGEREA
jgi:hypothetical protein